MTSQTIETKNMGNAKNIYWNDKREAYIVYLQRYGQVFYKLSYSLEDAIELRDKVLEFFKQHKRKPSSEELGLERKKPVFARPVEKRVAKPSVKCKTCTRSSMIEISTENFFTIEEIFAATAIEYTNQTEKF